MTKHLKEPLSQILLLTEDPGIAIIEKEAIEIVDIEPAEYPAAGVSLAVYAGDNGLAGELAPFVFQKDINIEVPGPAPGLVLNLEGEGP